MALPQAIDIRISMLRLAPQCFAFTSYACAICLCAQEVAFCRLVEDNIIVSIVTMKCSGRHHGTSPNLHWALV